LAANTTLEVNIERLQPVKRGHLNQPRASAVIGVLSSNTEMGWSYFFPKF
jgi:hypothetical protein